MGPPFLRSSVPPFLRSSVPTFLRSSVVRSSVRPFVRSFVRACGTSLVRWMALQCAKRTASRRTASRLALQCAALKGHARRLALQCASVREAHCAQATVAHLVTFESLKWTYSFATNSALFIKLGSLLYVRCRHRSAKSTAVSNKTFLFQVTNIYLFCGSVTLST